MPGTTTTYGLPYGVIGDNLTDLLDVQSLAEAVEAQFLAATGPTGDPSNTQYLTGHVAANQSDRKVVLTTTFTLPRAQTIFLGARARVDNQSNGSGGDGAISVVVDGNYDHTLNSGPMTLAAQGSIGERIQFVIPTVAYGPLTAGSHTVNLEYDQDSTTGTKWVMGGAIAHNSRNYYPTSLIVVI